MRRLLTLGLLVALAACSRDTNPQLLNIRQPTSEGPDEFSVLPTKPLEMPKDYAALPPPTPGGANLTDPSPFADADAALGGNAAALARRSTDGGLVAYAGRYGVAPDIRQTLAREDLEYRRVNNGRLLERLFSVNVYFKAYRPMELDQYAELARMRAAGIPTPAAPPDPALAAKK